jgi:multiple sugar transport system permease protein
MATPTQQYPAISSYRTQELLNKILVTGIAVFILMTFIAPLGYMFTTAIKSKDQMSDPNAPWYWPSSRKTIEYQGKELEIFQIPLEDGIHEMAILKKNASGATLIDPQNPDAGPIEWQGNWRKLSPVYLPDAQWENFVTAWQELNFPLLFRNSMIIAGVGTIGALISAIFVAYGFARFKFRGKNILFLILIATIILPVQATLIPTYLVFAKIGWTNTLLPLIVPHFFANGYNVFLLRQYFMQIPRELDEAAMIDGANPFQILFSVIIPQSVPAITAVSLFHFFFAWNDFFTPLVYLASNRDLWPLSVGLQKFNALYGREPNMIQNGALITLVLPVIIFFVAQRVFMQGVVFTGVEK